MTHRIVIIGGGAGGLELATRLGDKLGKSGGVDVTLVDRCPTHVWKPLLHEVATGSLDPQSHQIEYAAQALWHHFRFVPGEMIGLDRTSRRVTLGPVYAADAGNDEVLPARYIGYDTLVLALGSRTHFFGVDGAQTNSITLDTLEEAERLRRRLLQACIRNRLRRSAGLDETVKIAIIGGGATGVELAAELRRMESHFRQFGLQDSGQENHIRVTLFEAGSRLLPALPERVSSITRELLEGMAIDVSVSDPVVHVGKQDVRTKSGRAIPADITIWAAGIKAPDCLASLDGIDVNHANQIKVSRTLQSISDPNIFALGDCASCSWTTDRTVPPRAQAAHQQAMYLAKALRKRIQGQPVTEFHYNDHGSLVSLGAASAVGSLVGGIFGKNLLIEGFFAKIMYVALYRKHRAAVSGLRRTMVDALAHQLRRYTTPRVKLH
jgi:NADH:ubiquinone reductase (H+-translocating)